MFTFLHVADIHLDSPLRGLARYPGAPVDAVRSATRRALENLVEYSLAQEVALLVIAGDVYDGDWQDFQTGLHFTQQMRRLRDGGARVVLVRGNHDAENSMTKDLALPEGVVVLPADAPGTVVFDDLGVAVHGRSYAVRAVTENFVPGYPDPLPGLFNIGLLHTAVTGSEGHAPYAPCRVDEMLTKGYDYWALGHVHEFRVLHEVPPVVYSGNIQGRNIRETGPKGCVRVDVDDAGTVSLERVFLDVMRWAVLDVDVSDAADVHGVVEAFAGALTRALDEAEGLPLAVRVELGGASAAHAALIAGPESATSELRARAEDLSGGRAWVEKVRVRTMPPVDLAALTESDTPQGDLLRYIAQLADESEVFDELGADFSDLAAKLHSVPGTSVDLPDLKDEEVRRALLDDVRALVLPLFGPGRGEGGS